MLYLLLFAAAAHAADTNTIDLGGKVVTLTNTAGRVYESIALQSASPAGIAYTFADTNKAGGGVIKLDQLDAATLVRLGVSSNLVNSAAEARRAKEAARIEALFAARDRLAKQPEAQEPMIVSNAVQMALDRGIFTKVQTRGRNVEVWVGSPFYLMDYDTKKKSAFLVLINSGFEGRTDVGVTFRDNLTGKEVATLSALGFKVK